MTAKRILSCFPDYGKAPPEYLLRMTELLASYPPEVQERLVDLRRGIPGRCRFLPTLADIVEMAKELQPPPSRLMPGYRLMTMEEMVEESRRKYGPKRKSGE